MINFSLGSEHFLPRRFSMWWFHFAVEFLCLGEGCPSKSRWEESLRERGGILELICQEQKEKKRKSSWGLWRSALTCEWDFPAYPWKTETSAIVGVTGACLEGVCTCWGLNLPRFSPPTLTVTLAICVLIYTTGETVKNVHPPASFFSSPVPPPPRARGGCQDNHKHY